MDAMTSLTTPGGWYFYLDHPRNAGILVSVATQNRYKDSKKLWSCTTGASSSKRPSHSFKIQALPVELEGPTDSKSEILVWPSPGDEIPFWKREFPSWDASSEEPVNVEKDSDLMHIVHVTAEMAPIAKVGGLGDVVTGLARTCLLRGHKVDIILPFYECIQKQHISDLELITSYSSYHDGNWIACNAYRGLVSSIPVIFIEPSNQFFKGQSVYGGSYNELEAYLFFSRACLEWLQVTRIQPDIIHVHEWQTSALPLLYWDIYHHLSLQKPRLVLTIHNMEHYGECSQEQLSKCGLDGSTYGRVDKSFLTFLNQHAVDDRTIGHNPERLSLFVYSNAVVTVSPTYLNETLCSGWLASSLIRNRDKYSGILNEIDTAMWNLATDVFPNKIEGKRTCKCFVQMGLGLASEKGLKNGNQVTDKVPLVVCITRLVAQKGLHLITQLSIKWKSFEELSHMLYAAADIVLVPSIYEPCGLAQMIGMRYGAVPLVRKTGGLADTVFDMDDHSQPEKANGFVFEGIDEGSLNSALDRAFSYYGEKPNEWRRTVRKVMEIDNSWNNTAGKYINVYNS
ncbi:hypothetical protein RJ639_016683, partial [Escallonia herrerae]